MKTPDKLHSEAPEDRKVRWRQGLVRDIVFVGGLTSLTVGVWSFDSRAALIVLGVVLLASVYAGTRRC